MRVPAVRAPDAAIAETAKYFECNCEIMFENNHVPADTYDTWFELLANDLRRRLLFELARRAPSEPALAVPGDIVRPDEDAESLSLHLRHVHLPKLDDSDIVDWNREARTVSHGRAFDQARPLIRAVLSVDGLG